MEGYIYKLISPSGKCYIGQTVNLKRRLSDYKNFHHCEKQKKLFNAIRKYGFENFQWEIIEFINIESKQELQKKLNELEISYIKLFNSIDNGYNICKGGDQYKLGVKTSEETKQKQRDSWTTEKRKKLSDKNKGKRSGNALNVKPVLQYDIHGNFLKEFESITEACLATNCYKSNIKYVCDNKIKFTNNFIWRFKINDEYPIKIEGITIVKKVSKQTTIYQYNLSGELLNTFNSMKDAYIKTNISVGSISNCCNNKSKSAGGFVWKY